MNDTGFFSALFDFSFKSFVTSKIIKVLYVISLIGITLVTLFLIVAVANKSAGAGIFMLLVAGPILFVFWLTYTRVILELVIVFFRIAENLETLVKIQGGTPSVAAAPPIAPEPPAAPAEPPPVDE